MRTTHLQISFCHRPTKSERYMVRRATKLLNEINLALVLATSTEPFAQGVTILGAEIMALGMTTTFRVELDDWDDEKIHRFKKYLQALRKNVLFTQYAYTDPTPSDTIPPCESPDSSLPTRPLATSATC
jgi:hypothetical protein